MGYPQLGILPNYVSPKSSLLRKMPPTISKKRNGASPPSAPSAITQQGNSGYILKKQGEKKKWCQEQKQQCMQKNRDSQEQKREYSYLQWSLLAPRTRVTPLILAKKTHRVRLGLRLFMQQYNYKTCFLQKTKCREDFNADPLSNPTISGEVSQLSHEQEHPKAPQPVNATCELPADVTTRYADTVSAVLPQAQ